MSIKEKLAKWLLGNDAPGKAIREYVLAIISVASLIFAGNSLRLANISLTETRLQRMESIKPVVLLKNQQFKLSVSEKKANGDTMNIGLRWRMVCMII